MVSFHLVLVIFISDSNFLLNFNIKVVKQKNPQTSQLTLFYFNAFMIESEAALESEKTQMKTTTWLLQLRHKNVSMLKINYVLHMCP